MTRQETITHIESAATCLLLVRKHGQPGIDWLCEAAWEILGRALAEAEEIDDEDNQGAGQ